MGASQSKKDREERNGGYVGVGPGRELGNNSIKAAIANNKRQRRLLLKQARQAAKNGRLGQPAAQGELYQHHIPHHNHNQHLDEPGEGLMFFPSNNLSASRQQPQQQMGVGQPELDSLCYACGPECFEGSCQSLYAPAGANSYATRELGIETSASNLFAANSYKQEVENYPPPAHRKFITQHCQSAFLNHPIYLPHATSERHLNHLSQHETTSGARAPVAARSNGAQLSTSNIATRLNNKQQRVKRRRREAQARQQQLESGVGEMGDKCQERLDPGEKGAPTMATSQAILNHQHAVSRMAAGEAYVSYAETAGEQVSEVSLLGASNGVLHFTSEPQEHKNINNNPESARDAAASRLQLKQSAAGQRDSKEQRLASSELAGAASTGSSMASTVPLGLEPGAYRATAAGVDSALALDSRLIGANNGGKGLLQQASRKHKPQHHHHHQGLLIQHQPQERSQGKRRQEKQPHGNLLALNTTIDGRAGARSGGGIVVTDGGSHFTSSSSSSTSSQYSSQSQCSSSSLVGNININNNSNNSSSGLVQDQHDAHKPSGFQDHHQYQQQYKLNQMSPVPLAAFQRGLSLSAEERRKHGLTGLLPAAVQDQDLQTKAVMNFIENCKDELSKYVYLRNLKDFNERLFYATLMKNVEKLMPLVYTPTVGLGCQKFSEIYMRPRGLFITANDFGHVSEVLANWPERHVRVIVVTDGERILGLGDLGANGMGISIGKLSLYTALAGIPPANVLPITIDVGTNNETFLKDPFYIGLRQNRVRGEKYDQLMEEFMRGVVERWGRSTLIQFEDFGNATAFDLLQRYRNNYCTFNDDIQGTASVCLSGLISAAKIIGRRLADSTFLFYGAGEANLGTAHLLIMAMVEEGTTRQEAGKRIWLIDSKGLIVNSRTDLNSHKRALAQDGPQVRGLEECVNFVKPTAIIGASAQGGAFTEAICKKMAELNERPIIFALSNPTVKAECTALQAYTYTKGKVVFASGSPMDPVLYEGKTYITGQGNNAYIFPGVGLAAVAAHIHTVPEEVFLVAARALSDQLTSSDTSVGLIYPRLTKIREVTLRVATRVLEYLYRERLATYRPEPDDKMAFLRSLQYDYRYEASETLPKLSQMSLADTRQAK